MSAAEETFTERLKRLHKAAPDDDVIAGPDVHALQVGEPGYADQARVYCTKALVSIAAELAQTPEGGRNQALNNNALRAFRWCIAGHLDRTETAHRLRDAAVEAGLSAEEIRATLNSAWAGAVKLGPSHPEVRLVRPVETSPVDTQTGEIQNMEQVLVQAKLRELRVLAKARQMLKDEEHAAAFRPPPYRHTLTEELQIPDEPQVYAIDTLLPAGGNALLAAEFKAGKTTFMLNLLRAFADGEPFLGRFDVHPAPGRIAIFNYELGDAQMRSWLRQSGIRNTDAVAVLNLRGYALPITAPAVQDWIVAWLVEQDVSMWIADPFARASVGTDENSNTEVGVWLDAFDVIKQRAGVRDGVLPTHTGRAEQEQGQEHARGATRLDDWADVRWLLTKNEEQRRFFRATGRDVEHAEEALEYDEITRALTMRGGDRAWIAKRNAERTVLEFITAHPMLGVRDIRAGLTLQNGKVDAALASLKRDHYVRIEDVPGKLEPYVATGKRYEL